METALILLTMFLSVLYSVLITSTCIVFLHCFYDPGFGWSVKKAIYLAICYFTSTVLDTGLMMLLTSNSSSDMLALLIPEVITILTFIAELWIIFYDFKGKRLRGIFRYLWVSFIILLCTTLIDSIGTTYLFPEMDIYALDMYYGPMLIISGLYLLIFGSVFLYLYFRIYKKNIFLRFQRREKIFAIVYSILFLSFYVVIEYYGPTSNIALVGLGITFVMAAILVPVFFYYLQISGHYQDRSKYQEAHLQAELIHFQEYRQRQEETSQFRHDIRNNLLCVNDLLQQGKPDEASEYLKDLLHAVERLSKKYVTGDDLLDSIVGVKAQVMEQHGIHFDLDGVLAGGLPWKSMDICNVFANALDNAMEACQRVTPEKRRISMRIRSTPQFWFVTIENPVEKAVDTSALFQRNGGYTSKSDAAQHGIGTYNMKCTVESYGAMLKADCTDELFRLEIMIDKSSPA